MRRIAMPRDRNSLAFLYMLCARVQGVRPVLDAAGTLTGFTGPRLAVMEYLERMRPLQPPPPPDPARLTAKQQRQAVEAWRRRQKRGQR
jgi:hypothetical protein